MAYDIVKVEVFDPALLNEPYEHVRVELLTLGKIEPTHTDFNNEFTVIHYGQLMRIFSDDIDWDDEKPEQCAMIYNRHPINENNPPVFPVTVSPNGDIWEVYYMHVTKIQRLLRQGTYGYELLPHPIFAIRKIPVWYLQHRSRICTKCAFLATVGVEDSSEINRIFKELKTGNQVAQLSPYMKRMTTLCSTHLKEINQLNGRLPKSEKIDN